MKTKTRTLNLKQETLRTLDSADRPVRTAGSFSPIVGRRGLDAANAKLDAARAIARASASPRRCTAGDDGPARSAWSTPSTTRSCSGASPIRISAEASTSGVVER